MAAMPMPMVKRRKRVPSEVRRIERRVARWRIREASWPIGVCLEGLLTGLPIPLESDGNGNGIDDVEDNAFSLLEALPPHALRPAQHHAMGQHGRRHLFNVVGETIVTASNECQGFGS